MKRSKLLSASILIALVLSGARSGNAQPRPSTIQKNHRKSATKQEQAHPAKHNQPRPRPSVSPLPAIAPNRAAQDRSAAESAKRAAEQEAHLKRQEEIAVRTLAVTQKTLDITQRSLVIDHNLVRLTGGLALINFLTMAVFYFTMRANIVAANAAKESADTSRQAFYLANRPWVLVSDFWIEHTQVDRLTPSGHQVSYTGPPQIAYRIYNVGNIPGTLVGGNVTLRIETSLPDDAELAAAKGEALTLPPNTSEREGEVFIHNPSMSDAQWKEVTDATKTLFFFGYILYEGPLRTVDNGRVIFRTDFGASYQGDLLSRSHPPRVRMSVVPDPRYNRLS